MRQVRWFGYNNRANCANRGLANTKALNPDRDEGGGVMQKRYDKKHVEGGGDKQQQIPVKPDPIRHGLKCYFVNWGNA